MLKEQLSTFANKILIEEDESARIYQLEDGRILHLNRQAFFDTCDMLNISYENKINNPLIQNIPEIIKPLSVVYRGNFCCGYTHEKIEAPNYTEYEEDMSIEQRGDLEFYLNLYRKIEALVKKGHQKNLVFPDLCTCSHLLCLPNGEIKLNSHEKIQMGDNDRSVSMSSALGDFQKYFNNSKYITRDFRFKDEIDKIGLTILLFLIVFNVNLSTIGSLNPYTGKEVTLQDVFSLLNLTDEIFMNKVSANLSNISLGSYLLDDLYRIKEQYTMNVEEIPYGEKKLYKKTLQRKN